MKRKKGVIPQIEGKEETRWLVSVTNQSISLWRFPGKQHDPSIPTPTESGTRIIFGIFLIFVVENGFDFKDNESTGGQATERGCIETLLPFQVLWNQFRIVGGGAKRRLNHIFNASRRETVVWKR